MWQTLIVALIVAVAILYLFRIFFRKATRQQSPCAGCGGCTPTPYEGSRKTHTIQEGKQTECDAASCACCGSGHNHTPGEEK